MVNKMVIALGAGFIGSLGNVIALWGFMLVLGNFSFDKTFVYKQVFWGGLWALAYCLDFLGKNWVLKALIVGILASLVTFFVFKAVSFTPFNILRAFIVNVIFWGGISSYLYHTGIKH